jgi:hypothetical protein
MNAIMLFSDAGEEERPDYKSRETADFSYWASLSENYQPNLQQWNPSLASTVKSGQS